MRYTRPLFLLAGTFTLLATQLPAQAVVQQDPQSVNCPVTLTAQPRFDDGITLLPDQTSKHDRAGVHLHLEDPDGRSIRSAEITLRGTPATRGARPASFSTATPLTRTFHVVSGAHQPGSLTANLWLAHAATIESVSITAIDFASAPAWQASKSSSCITVPNGNRLLGSLR